MKLDRPLQDGRLAIHLSPDPMRFPFAEFAQALVDERNGKITEKNGSLGTDEFFWDIRMGDCVSTLHSQHYLGVFLCAAEHFVREYRSRSLPGIIKSLWRRVRGLLAAPGKIRE